MGVKFANAFGAEVVLFTTSPNKIEDGRRLGAHEVVVSKNSAEMKKHGSAFAVRCAGFLSTRRFGRNACGAAATKRLFCFRTGREGLEARPGIADHGPLSSRPIRENTGLPS